MTRYRIVPEEPTNEMLDVVVPQPMAVKGSQTDTIRWHLYRAMLSTSPAPTEEELDGLCRLMWGDAVYWDARFDGEQPEWPVTRYRNADRARMRTFLTALSAGVPDAT
jgi:hypothetical protein